MLGEMLAQRGSGLIQRQFTRVENGRELKEGVRLAVIATQDRGDAGRFECICIGLPSSPGASSSAVMMSAVGRPTRLSARIGEARTSMRSDSERRAKAICNCEALRDSDEAHPDPIERALGMRLTRMRRASRRVEPPEADGPVGTATEPQHSAFAHRAISAALAIGCLVVLACAAMNNPPDTTTSGSVESRSSPENPQIDSAAPDEPEREYLGHAVCVGCHSIEAEHWDETIHAKVFLLNPRTLAERRGCEACHGPGSEHLKAPTDRSRIISFTRESHLEIEQMNGVCLECHAGGARIQWSGSAHQAEEVACSDCHNPMTKMSENGLLREATTRATCFACHPRQRVEFGKRSHMPLFEGKIECDDCHQPHGSATNPLLRADSIFELCTNCHSDKRGPFIWEHAPVTEGCTSCHLPHGSNRDSLLVTSPPFLCQQCHAQIGVQNHPIALQTSENLASGQIAANRDPRIIGRGCVTCHVQIHGSNHPSGARFHR